jgi:hypothetical protein
VDHEGFGDKAKAAMRPGVKSSMQSMKGGQSC